MILKSLCAFLCATAALSSSARAATYSLDMSQSAMTYQFLSGWNMPSLDPSYKTFFSALNTGPSSPHSMPSLIQFDLSGLDSVSAADITSATMRLYLLDTAASGYGASPSAEFPVQADFSLITGGSWNEDTVTYANKPAAGEVFGSITNIAATETWVELDLTQVVRDWVSGAAPNYGLFVTQPVSVRDDASNAVFALFASEGYSTAGFRPELVVTAVPEPSACAAGMAVLLGALCVVRRRARVRSR